MPDPTPEQPPSWPPTSEPAATPTNPPRITARGVGHLPSAVPEHDPASGQVPPPPGPGLYGEPSGPAGDLDAAARRTEWDADLGGAPEVPRQPAGPQDGYQAAPPQVAQGQGAQGEWGESPDWPPKSSQDWMSQQSQTGWGLANGGAQWTAPSPAPNPDEAPADQRYRPEQAAPAPAFNEPPQGGEGSLEFPELRADPYEADVYGQAQYRGESGGQDLYQSDPYQADRLQAEAQQAREAYQAEQQAPPFPAATPPNPQAPYAEQQSGQFATAPYGAPVEHSQEHAAYDGALGGAPADAGLFGGPQQEAPQQYQAPEQPAQQSYGDQLFGGQPPAEPAAPADWRADSGAHQAPEPVPAQRRAEEAPAAEAAPAGPAPRVAPPTHRGARYVFYGIGGLITLGLIIGIVAMLGASPPREEPNKGGDDSDDGAPSESAGADEALTPERYTELAAAAGSAEWFSWRYGDAGEASGAEELPQVEGDALAAEPLMGDADRSVQGQLGYVTDDPALSGIDHVTVLESTDEALGLTPRAGGRFSDDGAPELELSEGATADCLAGLGGELGLPVALARPEQSAEINAHAVVAFSSGIIATTGISGAQGGTCLQLPAGQVPTDVALTDGNELALVTTWAPETQTGSLVVIALGDKSGSYQSSWSESYPGLPNPGHFAAAEVLGAVELPFGAPTSVDAWSNSGGSLSLERGTTDDGAHRDTVASAGYAIVGDLSASEVAVVDLASTLEGLAARYYDDAEFAFDAVAGEAAGFEGGVADVAATEGSSAVATADGLVHELDGDLAETAATEVGANPTCLVVGAQSGEYIATSRGTGTVSWVSGGEVSKELADARMTDPLCASETPALDAKNYAGSATVVLVADFEGQKLHSYLLGEASVPGGATVGGEGFAYGGAYEVAGKPWDASVTVDLE
ncbi:hypothetical protein [Glycomyces paridis]|uniref:Uncharacterized protein n=1 Tax=Glycomyces paridis TaxID=2126555 RepID=A0A4S8PKX0_9ACTN|nr:hypothetical protein [Glycomyces paridis]THV31417.1 hypothetical protein E9998_03380 [Glycomyces paridis]